MSQQKSEIFREYVKEFDDALFISGTDARLTSADISATKIVAKHSAGVPVNCIA